METSSLEGLRRKSLCHNPSVEEVKSYKGDTGWGAQKGFLEGLSWKDSFEKGNAMRSQEINSEGHVEWEWYVQSQERDRGQALSCRGELTYCRDEDKL